MEAFKVLLSPEKYVQQSAHWLQSLSLISTVAFDKKFLSIKLKNYYQRQ